jgi:hypothetical protein
MSADRLRAAVLAVAGLLGPAASAAAAPVVQSMVVGRGGRILSPARSLSASAASLTVAGRTCSIAASTPLAVLVDLRALGGPGFAVRDYGRCGSSPASSSQLFVYSLGGEANRGQDGWEYKVGGAAGSTGAADPSGVSGNGRPIQAGERVLWFWCEAAATGCQRTLEVSVSGRAIHGRPLTSTVYAYDNEGRGRPVAGAVVTLGSRRSITGSHGRATLTAPGARGTYRVSATRTGMVPSFPVTVAVG